jgi:hypothetical protein
MVAAAFIGLGEDVGSMVMAVAGGALVVIGVVAAWAGGVDGTNVG